MCIITFDIWKRCRGIEIEELEWHNVTFKWIHMAIYPFTDITHLMTRTRCVFKIAILLSLARRTWNSKTFIFVSFKLRIEGNSFLLENSLNKFSFLCRNSLNCFLCLLRCVCVCFLLVLKHKHHHIKMNFHIKNNVRCSAA